jgi:hypothetical protein
MFFIQHVPHWEAASRFFFHWLYSPLGPWPLIFFSFTVILQTVGLLGRVISLPQGLYLNTAQHKHRINTYIYQTSMPCVGFEPTIPTSERAKTVHALDRSAIVTGSLQNYKRISCHCMWHQTFFLHRGKQMNKNSEILRYYVRHCDQ